MGADYYANSPHLTSPYEGEEQSCARNALGRNTSVQPLPRLGGGWVGVSPPC
jgi:hypothetical protein